MNSAGAGDGLHGSHTLLLDGGRVRATQDELGGLAGEGGDTGNRSIFMVKLRIVAEDLICLLPMTRIVSDGESIPPGLVSGRK